MKFENNTLKMYHKPELIVHGNLKKITKQKSAVGRRDATYSQPPG
jgi:hypothetical protein